MGVSQLIKLFKTTLNKQGEQNCQSSALKYHKKWLNLWKFWCELFFQKQRTCRNTYARVRTSGICRAYLTHHLFFLLTKFMNNHSLAAEPVPLLRPLLENICVSQLIKLFKTTLNEQGVNFALNKIVKILVLRAEIVKIRGSRGSYYEIRSSTFIGVNAKFSPQIFQPSEK